MDLGRARRCCGLLAAVDDAGDAAADDALGDGGDAGSAYDTPRGGEAAGAESGGAAAAVGGAETTEAGGCAAVTGRGGGGRSSSLSSETGFAADAAGGGGGRSSSLSKLMGAAVAVLGGGGGRSSSLSSDTGARTTGGGGRSSSLSLRTTGLDIVYSERVLFSREFRISYKNKKRENKPEGFFPLDVESTGCVEKSAHERRDKQGRDPKAPRVLISSDCQLFLRFFVERNRIAVRNSFFRDFAKDFRKDM
jgi:hypothetical protein